MRVGTASTLISFKPAGLVLPPQLRVLLVTGDGDEVVDVNGVAELLSSMHESRGGGEEDRTGEFAVWHLEGRGHSPLGEELGHALCRQVVAFCFSSQAFLVSS
jgi:hypothetical protein